MPNILNVKFVTEPGEGMPIESGYRGECEFNAAQSESAAGGGVGEIETVVEG
jgi:hypothetical protein